MERDLILKRLELTRDKLLTLEEGEFNWLNYVSEWDHNNQCGTTCCIVGWYPKWFPEIGLRWIGIETGGPHMGKLTVEGLNYEIADNSEIHRILMEYHGLSKEVINSIFYSGTLIVKDLTETDCELVPEGWKYKPSTVWVWDTYIIPYLMGNDYSHKHLAKFIDFIIYLIKNGKI